MEERSVTPSALGLSTLHRFAIYSAVVPQKDSPLERLYRMLEQHLGRELTREEKRMVSLSEKYGIEADPTLLDEDPDSAA
jgi:hypothetical protein